MKFSSPNNGLFITGRELGKGGEGTVYELTSHSDLVLKLYNDPLSKEKIEKLTLMVSVASPEILAYAAWPSALAINDSGAVCGFVMRKLTGYVPLHNVFGPMDRKKMFPDKGYNFLVHVARNLAIAFHKLHEAGIVAGDVNEGNILISRTGMSAFIDCDSFQVKKDEKYFFCEVGVPRYTPPELLRRKTFDKVIRTSNTDNFSLAVLIFQMLFLGRHPFAGRNKTRTDIDEETAIRQHQFAYSLENARKKLEPPKDSLPITSLPDNLVALFHRAFEQDDRPTAAEWVVSLNELLSEMTVCDFSQLHSYPNKLAECPWCAFRKTRGIMYFLDDTYFQANTALNDIEQFINGFKPERIAVKKINLPQKPLSEITPAKPDINVIRYNRLRKSVSLLLGVAGLAIAFVSPALVVIPLLTAIYTYWYSPWIKYIHKEQNVLSENLNSLEKRKVALIQAYEQPTELEVYSRRQDALMKLIGEFRNLPGELAKRKGLLEESLYNEQLEDYLRQFDIKKESIPSIGKAKKEALYNSGIYTAAHLTKLSTVKVPGIGPALAQVLMNWRRQMSGGFVYIPEDYRINIGMQQVYKDVEHIKLLLKANIRKEYQSLNFLKTSIDNRIVSLEVQIIDINEKIYQAKADLVAFQKVAA